jgi:hypothetical protein
VKNDSENPSSWAEPNQGRQLIASPQLGDSITGLHKIIALDTGSVELPNTPISEAPSTQTEHQHVMSSKPSPASTLTPVQLGGDFGILDFSIPTPSKPSGNGKSKKRKSRSPQAEEPKRRTKNGSICVRCKQHHLRCNGEYPCDGCIGRIMWEKICVKAKFPSNCFGKSKYL